MSVIFQHHIKREKKWILEKNLNTKDWSAKKLRWTLIGLACAVLMNVPARWQSRANLTSLAITLWRIQEKSKNRQKKKKTHINIF